VALVSINSNRSPIEEHHVPKLDKILKRVESKLEDDDFLDVCEEAADEFRRFPEPFDAVEPVLKLMEEHEDIDFGTPGPLVHFVETFFRQGYETKLVESLRRRPTDHTLWMLNRMINGVDAKQRKTLVALLDEILARRDLSEPAREAAKEFRNLHKK
jgi:hypothetical protein